MNAQELIVSYEPFVVHVLRLPAGLTEAPRKTSLSRSVGSRRKLLSSAGSLVSLSFPRVCIARVCVCGRLKGVPGRILTRVRDSSRQRRHTGRRRAGGAAFLEVKRGPRTEETAVMDFVRRLFVLAINLSACGGGPSPFGGPQHSALDRDGLSRRRQRSNYVPPLSRFLA